MWVRIRGHLGHDLLRENVERGIGDDDAIQFAVLMERMSAAHSTRSSRVTGRGVPWEWLHASVRRDQRAARATEIARDESSWQTRSTKPTSMPNCNDAVATSNLILPVFRRCSASRRSLRASDAVMRRNLVFAQSLSKMQCNALGQAPRVDEHERGAMLVRKFGESVVSFAPLLVGCDRSHFAARDFDGKIHLTPMADINYCWRMDGWSQ